MMSPQAAGGSGLHFRYLIFNRGTTNNTQLVFVESTSSNRFCAIIRIEMLSIGNISFVSVRTNLRNHRDSRVANRIVTSLLLVSNNTNLLRVVMGNFFKPKETNRVRISKGTFKRNKVYRLPTYIAESSLKEREGA